MQVPANFGEITFPPFRLDCAREQLYRDDRVIALRPKAFAVLKYLAEHPGTLVTKDELLDLAWSGVSVGDAVLKGCIREIREALGDDPLAPRFIETAHRRGYRFIGVVDAMARSPSRAIPRPNESCVGRERELACLQQGLRQAAAGERQIVFVTGEPGIGKTSVIHSFLQQSAVMEAIAVGEGQCLEHYGASEPYLPMFDALARLCRGRDSARVLAVLRRYAPTWLAQMPAFMNRTDLETVLRQATGASPHRMLREMAEALEALTADIALVLVLEDLHWSDVSTIDLLAWLGQRSESARLLIIGTYRPIDVATRKHPLKDVTRQLEIRRRSTELGLKELSERDIAAYLSARFANHLFPDELPHVVHRRTEGHPLFMVHVLDGLVASGAIASETAGWALRGDPGALVIDVPRSVRQMIEQQIEALGDQERRVLEAGSVAGTEFSSAVVASAIGDDSERVETCCEDLVRSHRFIHALPSADLPDGTVTARYGFVHALHRDAVYDQIPVTRRVYLHRRVATALETLYGARAVDLAAELAQHFEQGRDHSSAATWFRKAAANAALRFANHEVVALSQRGLQALAHLPDSAERRQNELALQMTLGTALIATQGYASPEVEKAYARAHELCADVGNVSELFRVIWGLARFYLVRTPLSKCQQLSDELLRLAENANQRDLLQQAHNSIGAALFHLGEFEEARHHLERGTTLYAPDQHASQVLLYVQDPGVVCLSRVSLTLWSLGYPDRALARATEAIVLAKKLAHPFSEAFALSFAAFLYELRQEWLNARMHAEEALSLSSSQGFESFVMMSQVFRAGAKSALDPGSASDNEARGQLRSVIDTTRKLGTELVRGYAMAMLGRACARTREFDEASRWIDEGLAQAALTGERFYEAELHRLKGETLVQAERKDDYPRAEQSFRLAIEIARRQQARSWELRTAASLARLYLKQGRRDEVQGSVMPIYASFTEGFETADLQDARAVLEPA